MKNHQVRLWAVLFWLLVWQLVSMALGSEILLVSPLRVLTCLWGLIQTAVFWQSLAYSLLRIALGFTLGLLCGILLSFGSSRFSRMRELLFPFMSAIKAVPVASFIILALVWFSSKNLAVLISFLMVLPIIYASVLQGIESRDPRMLEMAAVFRVRPLRRFVFIDIPSVFPYLLSGCKSALGLAWKSGIAAEVIGIPKGSIGEHLQRAKVYLETPELFAWTVVIVLVSVLCEKLFLRGLTALMNLLRRTNG